MERPLWNLRLAKQDFKFSVAHFTLLGPGQAEPLHGHNYRMSIEAAGPELDEFGLLADADALKRRVRELCAELDDHVLLPERSPAVEVRIDGDAVECRWGDREYRFPADEVVLLPAVNTSMELLARWAWRALADDVATSRLTWLAVEVEETAGQSCRYAADLRR